MEQVDIALRHVIERHPEQLVEAIVPDELRLKFSRWLDVPVPSIYGPSADEGSF